MKEIEKKPKGLSKKIQDFIEEILFGSKWLLVPFYLGLIIVQTFYCLKYLQELTHIIQDIKNISEVKLMMSILTLIDIVMIANLIKMIITGSYQTFIVKVKEYQGEQLSSGLLKVKMGTSLIGVSSIHLLQAFINVAVVTDREIFAKVGIHLVFVLSTVGLAYIDYLSHKTDHSEHSDAPHYKDA